MIDSSSKAMRFIADHCMQDVLILEELIGR